MMNLTLDVMGTKMRVDYASISVSSKELVVSIAQKDNNQSEFKIASNPANLPDALVRTIVRAVHEDIIRTCHDVPKTLHILLEQSDV